MPGARENRTRQFDFAAPDFFLEKFAQSRLEPREAGREMNPDLLEPTVHRFELDGERAERPRDLGAAESRHAAQRELRQSKKSFVFFQ